MTAKMTRRRLVAAAGALGLVAPTTRAGAQTGDMAAPPCESEREVSGWRVKASLVEWPDLEEAVGLWECVKQYSPAFSLIVAFDASQSPTPDLYVLHKYRGGTLVLRAPDQTGYPFPLDAKVAESQVNLSEDAIATLAKAPLTFEFSAPGEPLNQYDTAGLPEAISAARKDLEKLNDGYNNWTCEAASDCFFTTAACGVVGLSDDCFELCQLRAFRDRFASRNQQNKQAVEAYYTLAPRVLSALERRPDAKRILLKEYWRVIAPCALLSALRCDSAVAWLYKGILNRLQAYAAQ